ncbi:hypothetical protein FYJ61_09865 [Lactobacillus equicursoris]|uniref:Uncharacterized protein n=1 Tax=Lactobacillus equicursoris TaxID=420645 RepID=A0A844FR80_9LACO|nr:hypothetical protein [Lactobacillus equicursoris]MST80705.1 hypothetical protein [Lactobacillus equicursoris]
MIENGHLVKAKNVLIKEFSQEEAVKINVKRYCLLAQLSRPTFYAYYGSLPQHFLHEGGSVSTNWAEEGGRVCYYAPG